MDGWTDRHRTTVNIALVQHQKLIKPFGARVTSLSYDILTILVNVLRVGQEASS